MKDHLSKGQLARCFVEGPTNAERQHLRGCVGCRTELERFVDTIASFRHAVRARIEDRVSAQRLSVFPVRLAPSKRRSKWRPALATAAGILLGVFPFFFQQKLPQVPESAFTETDPEALMDAISLHLLRTVPAPMEPAMAVVPNDDTSKQPGGIQ